ncbi:thiosulfate reductase cytochrome b subunit [Arthrobacter pigmenti]|uniref:Thiosulfate reductase cytochrome b subunit n=1 Tax=Arthrobacter pigmenti TaxID=271432 RepID=A0A846RRX3_9MICC|nr:cytochrome b/b6 domain-containing protein [Arthrobacter pigmenti]NJC24300.1 thiosulfate reductase cytochrome b subunit [Arthrobacter pigmenti]
MATHGRTLRRGLPRRSGEESWPPADAVLTEIPGDTDVPAPTATTAAASPASGSDTTTTPAPPSASSGTDTAAAGATVAAPGTDTTAASPSSVKPATAPSASPSSGVQAGAPAVDAGARPVRRGLPRTPGGDPWPPAGAATTPAVSTPAVSTPASPAPEARSDARREDAASVSEPSSADEAVPARQEASVEAAPQPAASNENPAAARVAAQAGSMQLLRRGLPRVPGGERWPAETAVVVEPVQTRTETEAVGTKAAEEPAPVAAEVAQPEKAPEPVAVATPIEEKATPPEEEAPSSAAAGPTETRKPLPEKSADTRDTAKAASERKPRSRMANLLLGAAGLLAIALGAVLFTRWFVTLGFMQDFLTTYPGETHLPEGAEPGFPAWVQWQHFFNFFLIVLIIKSGLQVRRETRPPGYWTPKWSKGGDGKISLSLWFHQALDILWLVNGLVFVVLLFVTSHWMRLVPTTWEVFPNALSALIQYVSLDWPTENGWVNYNSLQQLAYFATIFVAAPLAAITGARMSGIWPKNAKTLNRVYPVEWARAVHFPVMLYFVVFIIGHVALVFATGALRNLNHMYGGQDAVNWAGFWIFFVSLLLVVGAWIAAKPLILAPLAGLFGRVSSR